MKEWTLNVNMYFNMSNALYLKLFAWGFQYVHQYLCVYVRATDMHEYESISAGNMNLHMPRGPMPRGANAFYQVLGQFS